ncbi:MAG: hypothetical protein IKX90_03635 [Verrucomicrobia bacterium]|nr:hypothetical protein [Verrucomicrobiota bacterium]
MMKNSRVRALALLAALVTVGAGTAGAVDYSAVVKSFNPHSYWRLGETSGTTAVDEVGGHNAAYTSGSVLGKTGAIVGDSNTAAGFTGVAYGSEGNTTMIVDGDIGIGTVAEATFLCWVKVDGTQVKHTQLLMNRPGSGSATGLTIVSDNCLGYHWNDASATYNHNSGLALIQGEWCMAALAVNATSATFYLGDSKGNLSKEYFENSHSSTTLSTVFAIGGNASSGSDRCFKGDLDEAAVFTYALNEKQIEAIYKSGLNKPVPVTYVNIVPSNDPFYEGLGTLTAEADGALPTYQWYLNGEEISVGKDGTIFGIIDPGDYTVKATSGGVSVTSHVFTVQPASKPIFTTVPTGGGERYVGGRLSLEGSAEGSMPISYQWKLNGKAIEGATGRTLDLVLTDNDFGDYTLEATNDVGVAESRAVTVIKKSYAAGSWTEAVMKRNPLAFFRFDDTINSSAGYLDDKGNPVTGFVTDFAGGHTGYYYDVYETDLVDGAIAQDSSKAVRFNGGSYVGTRLQLNSMAKSGFTTMGWVRRDSDFGSFTTRGGYFGQNDLNEFGDGNDTETIECWCANGMQIKVKHGFVDKRWSMIALTYDGSMLTLYINGKVVGTSSGTLNASAGTGYYFNVGGGGIFNNPETNMDYFMGEIDEIAMFDTCMTSDDIQEFYFKGFYGPGAAPEITIQPVSVESYENPDATWTMSVTAGGTSPLSYQWYKGGTAIEDATSNTITGYFTEEYAGSYYVVVSNNYGSAKSDNATVTLRNPDPNSYEGVVVALNPYAYWRFGEKSGTTAAEFINAFNGKYDNGQTLGQAGALKGDNDTAVLFDGTRYVTTTGIDLQSNTVTMAVWLKPNGSQVDYTEIMFNRSGSSTATGIDLVGNQVCYHWRDASDTYGYRSGLVLTDGEWNFVVMAVSPTAATFYLGDQNGNLKSAQNVAAHDNGYLTENFAIGGYIDSAGSLSERRFKGVIDEPVIFSRTLTEEEITRMYQAGLSGTSSAPVIKTQPADAEAFVGEEAVLSVGVIGTAPLTYVWTKDGEVIEGANAATLVIAGEKADEGTYQVTVSNNFGSAVSAEATVTMYYKPTSVDLTGDEYKLWTHLKFDNNLDDSSVNGNGGYDGSFGNIEFTDGMIGSSVVIKTDVETGIYNYVALTNPLYLETEPLTVAFWTKFITEAPNDLPWLCNTANSFSDKGFTLAPGYAGAGTGYAPNGWSWSIQSWNDNTGINKYGPDNTMPAGEWHHLVFVLDPGKTMKVFLNGELVSTTDISSVVVGDNWLDNYSNLMNIGQTATGGYGESVEMLMDDMGIWKTALSDVNARSIYYAGINGNSFDEKKGDVKPEFILDPVGATVYQIDSTIVTMTVEVKGTEPIEVTWTKDGEKVGTGLTLDVACVEGADGNYQAIAKNAAGEATSAVAVIAYREPESAYEELVASLNPVAFYRFDDNIADGIAVDYVAGRNGVYHNVAVEQQVNGAIYEDASKSIEFKGTETSSYISTPIQLNTMVANGAMSFMGWIKITSFIELASLYGQNDLIEFGHDTATSIRAWSSGPGNISGTAPADGQWAMVTITYSDVNDNVVESLYINDVLVAQYNGTTKINSTQGTSYYFNIGAGVWNATGNYFNGCVDDIAIFPTTLSAENISYLYNVGKYGPGAAPTVEVQPVGAEIYANDGTYTLSMKPVGTPPMTVKWYLNGNETAYEGESVQIARTTANAGSWTAVVSNAYGKAESEPAVISFYQPKSDYEALVASLMPLAYWRLGEAEGTTAYEYASDFNGVYKEYQTLGAAGAIANDPDTAVTFDGTSYTSVPGMSYVAESLTMLAWIKPNGSVNNYTGILFDRGNSAVGIDIVDNQPCYHWNDTQYGYRSGLQLTDGAWNMIAMVVTPTEATFYLGDSEGNLTSAVNTATHSPAKLTSAFSIGGDKNWSDRRFKGDIDEPVVFGYALSADQIESIYKKGMGGDTPTGPALSFEMTDLGLILTWEKGKLEIGATTEGPWVRIESASNEGYIYNGESGTVYFRLVEE